MLSDLMTQTTKPVYLDWVRQGTSASLSPFVKQTLNSQLNNSKLGPKPVGTVPDMGAGINDGRNNQAAWREVINM